MKRCGLWLLALAAACSSPEQRGPGGEPSTGAPDLGVALPDLSTELPAADLAGVVTPFDPDAACATAVEQAEVTWLPVDIIWVVDNSTSMQPAIDQVQLGLNAFAQLIAGKNLDYQIVLLSLRAKPSATTVGGSARYGVCIPPPLAGDDNCGNGPRFFQSSIDVLSTQPLEQLLGTLGQTNGYKQGQQRGGEPWRQVLRANATKTIVVVSDDNARLSATQFETFAGGTNPFNSNTLPPGILDASWGGLFAGYTFDALYGWGSTSDPSERCTYPDKTQPPSAGLTYTTLVAKTGGVRAQICDGAAAWSGFFDGVAQAVAQAGKISCDLAIPTPSQGTLDPSKVNVSLAGPSGAVVLGKVADAAACGAKGGWYYDDEAAPTRVLLCPTSCAEAQSQIASSPARIDITFGCSTIIL